MIPTKIDTLIQQDALARYARSAIDLERITDADITHATERAQLASQLAHLLDRDLRALERYFDQTGIYVSRPATDWQIAYREATLTKSHSGLIANGASPDVARAYRRHLRNLWRAERALSTLKSRGYDLVSRRDQLRKLQAALKQTLGIA